MEMQRELLVRFRLDEASDGRPRRPGGVATPVKCPRPERLPCRQRLERRVVAGVLPALICIRTMWRVAVSIPARTYMCG